MKYSILILNLVLGLQYSYAQSIAGLQEMQVKSNEFTKYVMSEASTLHDKLPTDVVPMNIIDFALVAEDSLAMNRIHAKFVEYYNYLLSYQQQNGFTLDQLSSIYIDSAKDEVNGLTCFSEWYKRDVHTISMTLACYSSNIESIKESCIARSIHSTILNNANVAECIKEENTNK